MLAGLGPWVGGRAGLLVYQACAYVWHRTLHGSAFMWRGSPPDAPQCGTAGYDQRVLVPLDIAGWVAVSSIALTLLVGLSAEATTVALLAATLLAMFTHTNVRTPRWLGYLVQRPESHSWHHARGRHRDNYSELLVFDLLFGTFSNHPDFAPETGFHDGASTRARDMVLFRDVDSMLARTR